MGLVEELQEGAVIGLRLQNGAFLSATQKADGSWELAPVDVKSPTAAPGANGSPGSAIGVDADRHAAVCLEVVKSGDGKCVGLRSQFAGGRFVQAPRTAGDPLELVGDDFKQASQQWSIWGASFSNCTLVNKQYPARKQSVKVRLLSNGGFRTPPQRTARNGNMEANGNGSALGLNTGDTGSPEALSTRETPSNVVSSKRVTNNPFLARDRTGGLITVNQVYGSGTFAGLSLGSAPTGEASAEWLSAALGSVQLGSSRMRMKRPGGSGASTPSRSTDRSKGRRRVPPHLPAGKATRQGDDGTGLSTSGDFTAAGKEQAAAGDEATLARASVEDSPRSGVLYSVLRRSLSGGVNKKTPPVKERRNIAWEPEKRASPVAVLPVRLRSIKTGRKSDVDGQDATGAGHRAAAGREDGLSPPAGDGAGLAGSRLSGVVPAVLEFGGLKDNDEKLDGGVPDRPAGSCAETGIRATSVATSRKGGASVGEGGNGAGWPLMSRGGDRASDDVCVSNHPLVGSEPRESVVSATSGAGGVALSGGKVLSSVDKASGGNGGRSMSSSSRSSSTSSSRSSGGGVCEGTESGEAPPGSDDWRSTFGGEVESLSKPESARNCDLKADATPELSSHPLSTKPLSTKRLPGSRASVGPPACGSGVDTGGDALHNGPNAANTVQAGSPVRSPTAGTRTQMKSHENRSLARMDAAENRKAHAGVQSRGEASVVGAEDADAAKDADPVSAGAAQDKGSDEPEGNVAASGAGAGVGEEGGGATGPRGPLEAAVETSGRGRVPGKLPAVGWPPSAASSAPSSRRASGASEATSDEQKAAAAAAGAEAGSRDENGDAPGCPPNGPAERPDKPAGFFRSKLRSSWVRSSEPPTPPTAPAIGESASAIDAVDGNSSASSAGDVVMQGVAEPHAGRGERVDEVGVPGKKAALDADNAHVVRRSWQSWLASVVGVDKSATKQADAGASSARAAVEESDAVMLRSTEQLPPKALNLASAAGANVELPGVARSGSGALVKSEGRLLTASREKRGSDEMLEEPTAWPASRRDVRTPPPPGLKPANGSGSMGSSQERRSGSGDTPSRREQLHAAFARLSTQETWVRSPPRPWEESRRSGEEVLAGYIPGDSVVEREEAPVGSDDEEDRQLARPLAPSKRALFYDSPPGSPRREDAVSLSSASSASSLASALVRKRSASASPVGHAAATTPKADSPNRSESRLRQSGESQLGLPLGVVAAAAAADVRRSALSGLRVSGGGKGQLEDDAASKLRTSGGNKQPSDSAASELRSSGGKMQEDDDALPSLRAASGRGSSSGGIVSDSVDAAARAVPADVASAKKERAAVGQLPRTADSVPARGEGSVAAQRASLELKRPVVPWPKLADRVSSVRNSMSSSASLEEDAIRDDGTTSARAASEDLLLMQSPRSQPHLPPSEEACSIETPPRTVERQTEEPLSAGVVVAEEETGVIAAEAERQHAGDVEEQQPRQSPVADATTDARSATVTGGLRSTPSSVSVKGKPSSTARPAVRGTSAAPFVAVCHPRPSSKAPAKIPSSPAAKTPAAQQAKKPKTVHLSQPQRELPVDKVPAARGAGATAAGAAAVVVAATTDAAAAAARVEASTARLPPADKSGVSAMGNPRKLAKKVEQLALPLRSRAALQAQRSQPTSKKDARPSLRTSSIPRKPAVVQQPASPEAAVPKDVAVVLGLVDPRDATLEPELCEGSEKPPAEAVGAVAAASKLPSAIASGSSAKDAPSPMVSKEVEALISKYAKNVDHAVAPEAAARRAGRSSGGEVGSGLPGEVQFLPSTFPSALPLGGSGGILPAWQAGPRPTAVSRASAAVEASPPAKRQAGLPTAKRASLATSGGAGASPATLAGTVVPPAAAAAVKKKAVVSFPPAERVDAEVWATEPMPWAPMSRSGADHLLQRESGLPSGSLRAGGGSTNTQVSTPSGFGVVASGMTVLISPTDAPSLRHLDPASTAALGGGSLARSSTLILPTDAPNRKDQEAAGGLVDGLPPKRGARRSAHSVMPGDPHPHSPTSSDQDGALAGRLQAEREEKAARRIERREKATRLSLERHEKAARASAERREKAIRMSMEKPHVAKISPTRAVADSRQAPALRVVASKDDVESDAVSGAVVPAGPAPPPSTEVVVPEAEPTPVAAAAVAEESAAVAAGQNAPSSVKPKSAASSLVRPAKSDISRCTVPLDPLLFEYDEATMDSFLEGLVLRPVLRAPLNVCGRPGADLADEEVGFDFVAATAAAAAAEQEARKRSAEAALAVPPSTAADQQAVLLPGAGLPMTQPSERAGSVVPPTQDLASAPQVESAVPQTPQPAPSSWREAAVPDASQAAATQDPASVLRGGDIGPATVAVVTAHGVGSPLPRDLQYPGASPLYPGAPPAPPSSVGALSPMPEDDRLPMPLVTEEDMAAPAGADAELPWSNAGQAAWPPPEPALPLPSRDGEQGQGGGFPVLAASGRVGDAQLVPAAMGAKGVSPGSRLSAEELRELTNMLRTSAAATGARPIFSGRRGLATGGGVLANGDGTFRDQESGQLLVGYGDDSVAAPSWLRGARAGVEDSFDRDGEVVSMRLFSADGGASASAGGSLGPLPEGSLENPLFVVPHGHETFGDGGADDSDDDDGEGFLKDEVVGFRFLANGLSATDAPSTEAAAGSKPFRFTSFGRSKADTAAATTTEGAWMRGQSAAKAARSSSGRRRMRTLFSCFKLL